MNLQLRLSPILNKTLSPSLSEKGYNLRIEQYRGVITYIIVVIETIFPTEIYLKNEHDTVDAALVVQRLKDEGLV